MQRSGNELTLLGKTLNVAKRQSMDLRARGPGSASAVQMRRPKGTQVCLYRLSQNIHPRNGLQLPYRQMEYLSNVLFFLSTCGAVLFAPLLLLLLSIVNSVDVIRKRLHAFRLEHRVNALGARLMRGICNCRWLDG